jgi:hypothetical protein
MDWCAAMCGVCVVFVCGVCGVCEVGVWCVCSVRRVVCGVWCVGAGMWCCVWGVHAECVVCCKCMVHVVCAWSVCVWWRVRRVVVACVARLCVCVGGWEGLFKVGGDVNLRVVQELHHLEEGLQKSATKTQAGPQWLVGEEEYTGWEDQTLAI